MQKNTKLYIAYGSNMNLEQMQRRCPTAKVVTSIYLEGYRLRFMGRDFHAVATIEPSADDLVPVTIWEIHPEDERSLDIYEGYPHLYRKETLQLKFGKKTLPAMAYIINEEKMLYGQPSENYFNVIREGYVSAGFDPKLLHQAVAENCIEITH